MNGENLFPDSMETGAAVGFVAARIKRYREWSDGLLSVELDLPFHDFEPGQFVSLGLVLDGKMVKRAYSLASAPGQNAEFLIVKIIDGSLSLPILEQGVGARVWISQRAAGYFTLSRVPSAETLWMIASGTGLAPFVSMLRTEVPWTRYKQLVLVHGVRSREHAAYAEEFDALSVRYRGRFTRIVALSRDEAHEGEIQGRLTEALVDGRLEALAGAHIQPSRSQVMVCGNPEMVREVKEFLEERGIQQARRGQAGHLTTERYW